MCHLRLWTSCDPRVPWLHSPRLPRGGAVSSAQGQGLWMLDGCAGRWKDLGIKHSFFSAPRGACFMPTPQGPEAGASARQSPGLRWLVCLDPGLSAQRPRRGSLLPWIISRALAPFSSRDPRAQRGLSSRSERLGLWPRAGLPRVQLSRLLPSPAPTAPGAPRGPSWTRRTCSWKPGTLWSQS